MITLPAVLIALASAAPPPPPAPARGETAVRAELDGLQRAVESAVAGVSRPAGLLVGATARAYHVKGFGAMVVLAPRLLPRAPRAAGAMESRVRADLARTLEDRHRAATDPAERRRLRRAIEALRAEPGEGRRRTLARRPPHPPLPPVPPGEVRVLLEDAEAFRREAEAAMERAERDVLVRLRVPAPPEAPAPPDVPVTPEPPAAPAPPFAFALPPGMPFVFVDERADAVAPERVLADVRGAIARGLAAHRGRLAHLAADEVVAVAIDFVPAMADRATARTVVARAKKGDLLAARAGRLTAAELEQRIAFDEY